MKAKLIKSTCALFIVALSERTLRTTYKNYVCTMIDCQQTVDVFANLYFYE